MPRAKLVLVSQTAEPLSDGSIGALTRPSKSYRPSNTRDSRHMSVRTPESSDSEPDSSSDESQTARKLKPTEFIRAVRAKRAAGAKKSTTKPSKKKPKKKPETIVLDHSDDSSSDDGEDASDVFNIYAAMRDALNTRSNAKNGYNPESLLQLLKGLIEHRDMIVNILQNIEGEDEEETFEYGYKATMFDSVVPDGPFTTRQSRKGEVVESLIKIWEIVQKVGVTLPPKDVITGRARRNSPEAEALDAFGEYTSVMLETEYSCMNARAEKNEKHKFMRSEKITGEFTSSFSSYHNMAN